MNQYPPSFYFAPSPFVDNWKRAGARPNRDETLERLLMPLASVSRYGDEDHDRIGASVYANRLSVAGVATLGQLVCLGVNPTFKLSGVNRGNAAAFNRCLHEFWPKAALPPWPSPAIGASIYPMLRSTPAFPWIVDSFRNENGINPRGVVGVPPLREQGWTVELLLSAPSTSLTSIFESRKNRTSEIIEYYKAYADEFTPAPIYLEEEQPVDWETYVQ